MFHLGEIIECVRPHSCLYRLNSATSREGKNAAAFLRTQQGLQAELDQLECKENNLDQLILRATIDLNLITERQDKKYPLLPGCKSKPFKDNNAFVWGLAFFGGTPSP